MKKIFATLLSLALVLSLSVCALATQSFDPTLKVESSADGKTITVTMNALPDGVSAELVIPCDGWEWATVKDSSGKTVEATFGEVDTNPDPEVEQLVDAVTFDAVGGTYTITKSSAPSGGTPGGYYPIVTPTTPVEKPEDTKPEDTKPVVTPTTPVEDDVTPEPEDTTPVVPEAPTTDDAPAVDNTPADDATQNDSGNSVGLWIGVALAVLVVAIIVVVILIKRKKA